MKRFAIVTVLAWLAACGAPSNHDPHRYGTVKIATETAPGTPGDTARSVAALSNVATDLGTLGPNFASSPNDGTQTITVRFVMDCSSPPIFANGVVTAPSLDLCSLDETTYEAFLAHAIEAALGMQTICLAVGDAPACSSVGYGAAVMNPLPTDPHPTDLDIAEFRRTHP